MSPAGKKKIVVWFRNDLRLDDNEPLVRALELDAIVYPAYCFDPRQFVQSPLGLPKTGPFRARFLLEALSDLQTSLRTLGSELTILRGYPELKVPEFARAVKASAVFCQKEVTWEELIVETGLRLRLKPLKMEFETFWGTTLFHIEDLPFEVKAMPDVYSHFRKQIDQSVTIRAPLAAPVELPTLRGIEPQSLPSLADLGLSEPPPEPRAVLQFRGGEQAGRERLHRYLWSSDALKWYLDTRNNLTGPDCSSHFSPWLSLGCLSPRRIHMEVMKYERERTKNDSTYWFLSELAWRDFFRYQAMKYGNRIFKADGIKEKPPADQPAPPKDARMIDGFIEHDRFSRWQRGATGIPLIDANMRELLTTGWMSNRGRQITASFLAKELKSNWLWGAEHFESYLIDYDVCSNYGNWMYVAGVGADPREHRRFNVLKQAQTYDADGAYVRTWVPELRHVPASFIHQPHKLSRTEQERLKVRIGTDYPTPLIEEEKDQIDLDL